jgi:hypothetical protein
LITGTYGAYSLLGTGDCCRFSGSFLGLNITDYQPPYDSVIDQQVGDWWSLRENVSSNALNGRSVIALSILENISPDSFNGPSFSPPIPGHLMGPDIQMIVQFSDGSIDDVGLTSLALVQPITVPEPSSLTLLPIGLLGICFLKKRITARP